MRNLLLLLALAAGGVGCDSADDAAAAASPGAALKKTLSPEAARMMASMVSAVSAGAGASSVDVKFELNQRPEVGKPVDISLALIPILRLERLYARFQAGEGLELVKGGQTDQIARPATGVPITHTVTVVPKRDGIFTVTAVVLTDSQSESVSRNFSIPLIAGAGLPGWTPKSAVARSSAAYVTPPQNPAGR